MFSVYPGGHNPSIPAFQREMAEGAGPFGDRQTQTQTDKEHA